MVLTRACLYGYSQGMTTTQTATARDDCKGFANGMKVRFRNGFSTDLDCMVFEIEPFSDGTLMRTAHPSEGGYDYVSIRVRVGKRQRWACRFAKVSDLECVTCAAAS